MIYIEKFKEYTLKKKYYILYIYADSFKSSRAFFGINTHILMKLANNIESTNKSFINKAPKDIVDKEKDILKKLVNDLNQLESIISIKN